MKYNTDVLLQKKYFDFAEYVLNYRAMDYTSYFDVFASFIEIMKEKFEQKCHNTFIKPNKEQMIDNDDKLKNLLSNNEIIYSDMTGVGKSRYINSNVSINNYI